MFLCWLRDAVQWAQLIVLLLTMFKFSVNKIAWATHQDCHSPESVNVNKEGEPSMQECHYNTWICWWGETGGRQDIQKQVIQKLDIQKLDIQSHGFVLHRVTLCAGIYLTSRGRWVCVDSGRVDFCPAVFSRCCNVAISCLYCILLNNFIGGI